MSEALVISGAPPRPWVLSRLRSRLLVNNLRIHLRRNRLRLGLILVLSLLIWGGLYGLFAEGFQFLRNMRIPGTYQALELLFGMFFLSLTGLMVFSTGLLMYGSLFRAPEAAFLLSTPARPDRIYAYKFHEALLFNGWGFMLLGTPLLVAYGIEMSASWYYYPLLLLYLLAFLVLPGAIGALACLLIVHFFPRQRKQALGAIAVLVLAGVIAWVFSAASGTQGDSISGDWLRKLVGHLQPAQMPFLPSLWMTRGLMAGATGEFADAGFHLLLLWSNALFFHLLSAWVAGRVYREAYSQVASTSGPRRKYGLHWSDRLAGWLLRWADYRTRIFVVKDFRTFRRDPIQWAQVLILVGILLLYFVNIPRLPHSRYEDHERGLIGLLNLAVISLMLATYTSRFVFPMMSLEGNKFWILGLLPLERDHLLISKFAYAATVTFGTSSLLTILSEFMLSVPSSTWAGGDWGLLMRDLAERVLWPVSLLRLGTVLVLSLGLSGISVGLGAYLVNLKETNPSKIATGFGGTINLLVSLAFVVVVILLALFQTMLYFAAYQKSHDPEFFARMIRWLVYSTVAIVTVGAAAVFFPLRLGIRAFRKMEF